MSDAPVWSMEMREDVNGDIDIISYGDADRIAVAESMCTFMYNVHMISLDELVRVYLHVVDSEVIGDTH